LLSVSKLLLEATKMNLRELIVLTYDLQKHYGNYRGVPETHDTVRMLNQALRFIGRKLKIYDPAISFTVSQDTPIYRLDSEAFSKVILRLDHIILNGKQLPLCGSMDAGLWSIAELNSRYPQWRTNDVSAAPVLAADYGSNRALLYPMPDEATSEGANFASGWVLPGVYSSNGTYSRGFGLIDKAELPAGYGGVIPGGGPQPPWIGGGGGMGRTVVPPGVFVAPPIGGDTGGGFGEPDDEDWQNIG
jgi:hypothetical protein